MDNEAGKLPNPGATLREHGLRPRKRLGQNFLRDRNLLRRIVDAADVTRSDEVLEIGPGTGSLTADLIERAGRVLAVELDDNLAELLRRQLTGADNLTIINENALAFDPARHFAGSYKLVANIPYYITGPLIRHFLESSRPPEVMVLMVQREVAERLVAAPGKLSLLGVSVQYYAGAELVMRVPAGAFYPRPKVDSAVVRLTPRAGRDSEPFTQAFFEVARAGFGMRRKQLGGALAAGLGMARVESQRLLEGIGIDPTRRAETLSIEEWRQLAGVWSDRRAQEVE